MPELSTLVTAMAAAGVLGAGLTGGILLAFSNFLMRSFGDLAPAEGMRAMQRINVRVFNPLFMGGFATTTLLSLVAVGVALANRGADWSLPLLVAGVAYAVGVLLVTGTRNVPLNDALARATADEEGMALWRQYLVDWTRWNHVRSAACVVSLAGHAVALAAVANG